MKISFKKANETTERTGELWVACRVNTRPVTRFEFPLRKLRKCFYHVERYDDAYEKTADMLSQYCGTLQRSVLIELCRTFVITPTEVRNCCRGKGYRDAKERKGKWGGIRAHRDAPAKDVSILSEKWKEAVREAAKCRSLAKFSIYAGAWSRVYGRPWPPKYLEKKFARDVVEYESTHGA